MVPDLSIDADWNRLYIDGEWVDSSGDETLSVEDPRHGRK